MHRAWSIASLLFGSGLCALVYQTVWLRQFRLIFGASTPASAAVLALFMAGLGVGGLYLGKRAERAKDPLLLYATLELGITISAALSPFLLDLVRWLYAFTGGADHLGSFAATVLRLLLAAVVMGVPVLLMGGTLPAAGRAATGLGDLGRRGLAVLYGVNTLGAVLGAIATTFFLFEVYGTRLTLWLACLLNAVVVLLARSLARRLSRTDARDGEAGATSHDAPASPTTKVPLARGPVLVAAFVTGFVFFLVELVWYRMSAPILGGSTYTFGLVLALALLGIGCGGALYAFAPPRSPGPGHLALTFVLEALLLMAPFALGDHLAHAAYFLREFGMPSFGRLIVAWGVIGGVIVLPAAVVSGYQFPLLLSLKGRGKDGVSVDVAEVYAANTLGSILGSLMGGFGLLPLLTAPGTWRLSGALLVVVGVVLAALSLRATRAQGLLAISVGGLALLLLSSEGPSALWRHSAIGAGRAELHTKTANVWRGMLLTEADGIVEEHEGRESSVAFVGRSGLAFSVNGKIDGNAVGDAVTTVGLGMIPALLHEEPKSAFVIGLGTGQTAGWLGHVETMERVDVVEIEPAVLRLAKLCELSNERMLDNPKVNVIVGDGREVLTTRDRRYDIIVSEPSNPYRAGIAGFYTVDFYREAEARLLPGGLFAQWMQGYEIEPATLQLVIATISQVFPEVRVFRLSPGDLLMVASRAPVSFDRERLSQRLDAPSFRRAFGRVFGLWELEGVLATHLATPAFTRAFAEGVDVVSSDDHSLLEYRFARSVGKRSASVNMVEILEAAERRGQARPAIHGDIDWARVETLRARAYHIAWVALPPGLAPRDRELAAFWRALEQGDLARAADLADHLPPPPPEDLFERLLRAEARAARDETPEQRAELEQELAALEAEGLSADVGLVRVKRALHDEELASLPELASRAFRAAREDPWTNKHRLQRTLAALQSVSDTTVARVIAAALLEGPFASYNQETARWQAAQRLTAIGMPNDVTPLCVKAYDAHVPWDWRALRDRAACFQAHAPERADQAAAELAEYLSFESARVEALIPDVTPSR